MKRTTIGLICLLGLIIPLKAFAAQKAKEDDAEKKTKVVTAKQAMKRFDKNADGKIEGAEAEALRKAFNGKRREALKAFDKNNDGKLDDAEITAIKAGKTGKKAEEPGKKKKEK